MNWKALAALAAVAGASLSADRRVDPTFLHRYVPALAEKVTPYTTNTSHYRPAFGDGDADASLARGVARYGELTVDPGGETKENTLKAEEQAWVVLEGAPVLLYGGAKQELRKDDFLYVAPGVPHSVSNPGAAKARIMIMGFRLPRGTDAGAPGKLQVANLSAVKKQVVGGHPPSTLYQLMMGDTKSTRDTIAAGHVLTSLYVMEFAPGGTNFPHHHETEEEIYMLLDGSGEMVAGSGMNGVEGRYPAKPGDAYFFRLNCTVGFYNGNQGTSHILAVRSLFPFRR